MEGYITGFSNILNTQAALFFAGLKQMNNFNSLAMQALPPFLTAEKTRKSDPGANWDLFMGNLNSGLAGLGNGFTAIGKMQRNLLEDQITAWAKGGNAYADVAKRQLTAIQAVGTTYPEAIEAIGPEFGFNYDGGLGFPVMVHTLRFNLCKVLPSVPGVVTKLNSKPIVVIPPFVLGANILALLPGEGRSYLHAFANAGIPTYILIMKPITKYRYGREIFLPVSEESSLQRSNDQRILPRRNCSCHNIHVWDIKGTGEQVHHLCRTDGRHPVKRPNGIPVWSTRTIPGPGLRNHLNRRRSSRQRTTDELRV
ncbi:MAG: hypothetical protein UR83_C0043G0008 [Candidatus Moranbacteria bacterium GW2011_GWF2_35_54]|nr:MAG: hypothetical protein UR83_C0043G0008 [Candidatus Moranbacteria bacterium GW2011_GWF2_35_54]